MPADTLAEILDWSKGQPAWQQDALRRLFTTGTLASEDLTDLLAIFKGSHGLGEHRISDPLGKAHLAIKGGDAAPVSLVQVTHHRGVNALAQEQTVIFGAQLTIVYGQNAAGKSGYARILKRACRSRSTEEILGNVLTSAAPLKAQATIRFRVGDLEQEVPWSPDTPPAEALAAISVFDAQCAPVYLRDKTDVAFRPFGLDIFDKLSVACGDLRRRLETEQSLLQSAPSVFPQVPEGTRVASALLALSSLTRPEDIRALGTLSKAETTRLKVLTDRRRDLQATDPKKAAQALDLRATRLDVVAEHVASLDSLLGGGGLASVRASHQALATADTALSHIRKTVLTPDLLPGTGTGEWRELWDAAGRFSNLAYPEKPFPVLSAGAKCVLCQQVVGKDAASRFAHFLEFVTSTAQEDVRKAERQHQSILVSIRESKVQRDDITNALAELADEDSALAERTQEFLGEAARVRDALLAATPSDVKPVSTAPTGDLRTAVATLRNRAAQLRGSGPTMEPKDAAELADLESRVVLGSHLQVVLDDIERRKRIAAYGQCIEDTGTKSITLKSTELTKRLVTERLRKEFQSELKKLSFDHLAVEIKTAGGSKGALFHQLAFANAPGISVAKVLSEGESRTLSLAAFLTELTTASAPSAIIFDDPVSSLDHIWRERIARRLVQESKARQVVLFTHDLVFLKILLDEARLQGVTPHHQYVRREGEASGVCSPDLPWLAMRLKERVGVLRRRWQAAEKTHRTSGPAAYEKEAREIYALLREAWEQGVEEILLNDAVERYRPSVQTNRALQLHDITKADCDDLEAGMTESSRWILGHDHAAADGTPFPDPTALKQSIENLEIWRARIAKRRGK